MKASTRLLATTVAALLLGLLPAAATAAPIIAVGPYVQGPTFTVPIEISGVSDLVTWQFDLGFDPADVQATAVTEGPFTSNSGLYLTLFIPGFIDNFSGLISIVAGAYLEVPPGPSGSGVLAYVDFTTIGRGGSTITVRDASVLEGSSPGTNPSPVVPEPGTWTLFGAGLLLLAVLERRRRQRVPAPAIAAD